MSWRPYLRSIFSEAARAVLPICLLLIILKAIFLGLTAASSDAFLLGMRGTLLLSAGVLLIVFGLSFFLQGLEHSLLPLGRTVGSTLPQTARLWAIMLFALVLGALATIAEPDLKVYVDKTIGLLGGRVGRTGLMAAVAAGAAAGLALGILRIALRLRFVYVLLPMVLVAGALTVFCPHPLNLISWDFAPVVSGSVTVPLFLALGLGLAAVMGGEGSGAAGFGLVSLASLGPVIAVLILGLALGGGRPAANPAGFRGTPAVQAAPAGDPQFPDQRPFLSPADLLRTAGHVLRIIVPVYIFLFVFQRFFLKRPIHDLAAVFAGVGVLVFGLVLFFKGLEAGFFPLTEGVGRIMPRAVPAAWMDIGLCLVLGLAVTFAEPAVLVFSKQVEKATAGAVPRRFMYIVLGVGVAFGFGLGIASSVRGGAGMAGLGLVIMASVGPVLSLLVVGVIIGRKTPRPASR